MLIIFFVWKWSVKSHLMGTVPLPSNPNDAKLVTPVEFHTSSNNTRELQYVWSAGFTAACTVQWLQYCSHCILYIALAA
uniref:Uncharacterized protein n=1 Tax=Poecilia reticulata TaxID=8081 RepID=A0A3P9NDW4_POERE